MIYLDGEIGAVYLNGHYHGEVYLGSTLVWSERCRKKIESASGIEIRFIADAGGVIADAVDSNSKMVIEALANSGSLTPLNVESAESIDALGVVKVNTIATAALGSEKPINVVGFPSVKQSVAKLAERYDAMEIVPVIGTKLAGASAAESTSEIASRSIGKGTSLNGSVAESTAFAIVPTVIPTYSAPSEQVESQQKVGAAAVLSPTPRLAIRPSLGQKIDAIGAFIPAAKPAVQQSLEQKIDEFGNCTLFHPFAIRNRATISIDTIGAVCFTEAQGSLALAKTTVDAHGIFDPWKGSAKDGDGSELLRVIGGNNLIKAPAENQTVTQVLNFVCVATMSVITATNWEYPVNDGGVLTITQVYSAVDNFGILEVT